jgi:integrase
MGKLNRLTTQKVNRLAKPGRYSDGGGLFLRVQTGAAGVNKSWVFRYQTGERERWMGLGSLSALTLASARQIAADARRLRGQGVDPIDQRNAQRAARALQAAKQVTFRQAASDYIRQHEGGWRSHKHRDQWVATLRDYAYPVLGNIAVDKIDTDLTLRVLRPIWRDKHVTAARLRGRIETIINFAVVDGDRANPARWKGHLQHKLDPRIRKVRGVKRHASLPYAELPEFMTTLRKRGGVTARCLEFVVLTGARSGEALGAQWSEIDFAEKTWSIPGPRMKGGKPHRVPLSDAALGILRGQAGIRENDFVFAGTRRAQLARGALQELLRRMDSRVTVHGFRSTFRIWAAECATGFPREVVESALAHAIGNAVEIAYQRSDLLARRRALMEAWAEFCTEPSAGSAVVPWRARAPSKA